jgi:hypothetical protein
VAGGKLPASYFFGTASALALEPKIQTADDFERVISVINNDKMADDRKLSVFGLTADTVMRGYYTAKANDFISFLSSSV